MDFPGCVIDETEQCAADCIPRIGKVFADNYESVAQAVIDMRETLPIGLLKAIWEKEWMRRLSFMAYACEHPARRKRTPMDVDKMVEAWLPMIRQLAIAHDVDEKDAASSALDDLLLPIIAAPVSQIREFYRKLVKQMKADKSVPFAIWRLFEFWGENVLDKIEKEQEVQLRGEIAKRIADTAVEKISKQDWAEAMVGALMWRPAEKLEAIESSLKSGQEPRVRGKESCLFMQVGEAEVML